MDEQPDPVSKYHPTIYYVKLDQISTARWEADYPNFRATLVQHWLEKAQARNKRTIEVWGKYGQLARINVEPLNAETPP